MIISVILLLPLFDSSSVFDHFIYQKIWHHVSITCRQQDDEKLSQFALMNCIYSSCSIFSILCIITTPCISIYLYKKIQNYKLTYRRFRIFININVTQMYQWYWWKPDDESNKGNNKITELRTILQRESQNS
jgi:hypothetical protein